MAACGDCPERVFVTDRAWVEHRVIVHDEHAEDRTKRHIYRPSVGGDLTSSCSICGLARSARRHDRTPARR